MSGGRHRRAIRGICGQELLNSCPRASTSRNLGVAASARLFQGKNPVDFDVFRINWDRIQQTVLLACGFDFDANAGAARSQGAEIDINTRVQQR
jgi:hypothetical protein